MYKITFTCDGCGLNVPCSITEVDYNNTIELAPRKCPWGHEDRVKYTHEKSEKI